MNGSLGQSSGSGLVEGYEKYVIRSLGDRSSLGGINDGVCYWWKLPYSEILVPFFNQPRSHLSESPQKCLHLWNPFFRDE